MLHDNLKIKYSLLRAYYEKVDRDVGNMIAMIHAKYDWYSIDTGFYSLIVIS